MVYFVGVCRETTSYEWFHELIERIELDTVFKFRFYITGKMKPEQVANIYSLEMENQNASLYKDPITKLSTSTFYGRPDWNNVFEDILDGEDSKIENRKERIGVFYCGPNGLGDTIIEKIRLIEKNGIKVDFYREKFT